MTRVGSISSELVVQTGGPIEHAMICGEVAKKCEKRRYDAKASPSGNQNSKSRRRAQNRKSSKSTSEGRKTHTAAMVELNFAVTVQDYSLTRTMGILDEQIKKAELELDQLRRVRREERRQ